MLDKLWYIESNWSYISLSWPSCKFSNPPILDNPFSKISSMLSIVLWASKIVLPIPLVLGDIIPLCSFLTGSDEFCNCLNPASIAIWVL